MERIATVVLVAMPAAASADPTSLWAVPAPSTAVARLTVEADLSKHSTLAPVSLAPDLVLGLGSGVAASVRYSRAAQAELGAGNGICLAGPRETLDGPAPCLDSVSGLAMGALIDTGWAVGRVGTVVRGPRAFALELGGASAWRRGVLWGVAAPTVLVALTSRDRGNRERIMIAAYGGIAIGQTELHVRSGLESAVQTFSDTYAIPLGGGASVRCGSFRIGADATLDRAFGKLNTTYFRSAGMYVEKTIGGGS